MEVSLLLSERLVESCRL